MSERVGSVVATVIGTVVSTAVGIMMGAATEIDDECRQRDRRRVRQVRRHGDALVRTRRRRS